MKLFIDENLPAPLVRPLSSLFPSHKFQSPLEAKTGGWEDIELIHELGIRDFDAIITLDRRQLANADERDALRDAGLDWIGVPPELSEWGGDFLGIAGSVVAEGIALYQQLATADPIGIRIPKPSSRARAQELHFRL